MIPLRQHLHLSLKQAKHSLKAFPAVLDAEDFLTLLASDLLHEVVVHAEREPKPTVRSAAGEGCTIVVTINAVAAIFKEFVGMVDGLTSADEPHVNLLFVT
jgi:hypothetical protein